MIVFLSSLSSRHRWHESIGDFMLLGAHLCSPLLASGLRTPIHEGICHIQLITEGKNSNRNLWRGNRHLESERTS